MTMKMTESFYQQNVLDVARQLIGKKLVYGEHQGIITETEAYRACDDEASHAFRGITKRTAVMFGPPGRLYVYLIYGLHYCVNIVTEPEGLASAVLIRSIHFPERHVQGPGNVCRYLGITKEANGINMMDHPSIYLTEGLPISDINATPRIGIRKAVDKPWRFVANHYNL